MLTHNSDRIGFAVVGPASDPGLQPGDLELAELFVVSAVRGRGHATFAIEALIEHYDVPRWELFVFKRNAASRALLERLVKRLPGATEGPIPLVFRDCEAIYYIYHHR